MINYSVDGVAIVLELLRVLAALKDYSKLHKDLYWKLLKVIVNFFLNTSKCVKSLIY